MDAKLERRLAGLPALDRRNAAAQAVTCKICHSATQFSGLTDFLKCAGGHVFGRSGVGVDWRTCPHCEFLFTSFFDDWTAEDFARFVYNDDYIKVDPEYSGVRSQRVFASLIPLLPKNGAARVLDFGGGAGGLARLLRERGIDATSYDPFSSSERPAGKFDLITCVEVFEHSPDPTATMAEVASFLAPGGAILLGVSLQPANIGQIGPSWWYCAPRNGHCSTYSLKTLALLGNSCALTLHADERVHWVCWCFADAPSDLARRIGPTFQFVTIGAPKSNAAGWHGAENEFRWSAAETLNWRFPVADAPATVRVKLLYKMEPVPGFARSCKLIVQGKPVPVGPGATIDIAMSAPGDITAVLTQDNLICPADRGSTDRRRLGVALLMD